MTYPHPGVIATSPQTEPQANPRMDDYFLNIFYHNIQVSPDMAADRFVLMQAIEANPFADKLDPPLKPNHPNQSKAVPKSVNEILQGII